MRMLVFLAIVLVAACTNQADPETTPTTAVIPPARTVLRVGADAWPSCLNPLLCTSTALREQILQHVLPVAFEVGADNDYRASPALAGEPTGVVESDGTFTISYALSPEARWSDGRRLTSSDIAGTWRAIMTTPGADTRGYSLITSIDDADPAVAVATLSESFADWRDLFGGTGGWILQADAFGATTDLTGQFVDSLPFGAGPFQLAAWDSEVAVLTENEVYWATDRLSGVDQVRIERVVVDELGDALTYDVLLPGPVSPAVAPVAFDEAAAPTSSVIALWLDQRDDRLQELVYRQVLIAAIDRAALVARAVEARPGSTEVPCLGWLPGAGPWCEAAAVDASAPDPALAAFVLAGEDWVRDEAGVFRRGDDTLTLTVSADPKDPATAPVADALAAALEGFGIVVERVALDRPGWLRSRPPESPAGIGVFAFDVGIDADAADLYGCLGGVASSVVGWCPDEVVTDSAALTRALDPGEQSDLVTSIADAARAAAIGIPLVTATRPYFVKPERVLSLGTPAVWGGPLASLWEFTVAT